MNKKILHISFCFPPLKDPEALVQKTLFDEVAKIIKHYYVLTVEPSTYYQLIDETISKQYYSNFKDIFRIKSIQKKFLFNHRLNSIFFYLSNKLFFIEPSKFWEKSSITFAMNIIKLKEIECIYSRASYHSSNLVGLALKKYSGLPWIAHFSDPWFDNPYISKYLLNRPAILRKETEIIRNADAIVFTSYQTLDLVMKKYPTEWRQKAYVIPHGFDSSISENLNYNKPHEKFILSHTGNFYGIRKPDTFLKAVLNLIKRNLLGNDFLVNFAGSVPQEFKKIINGTELKNYIQLLGTKSPKECAEINFNSDVLLLIDAPSELNSVFLPSKLVDYLSFRKPIIGITPEIGASAELLRNIDMAVCSPGDIEGIENLILKNYNLWKSGKLSISEKFIIESEKYKKENVAQILVELFEKVIKEKSK